MDKQFNNHYKASNVSLVGKDNSTRLAETLQPGVISFADMRKLQQYENIS